MSWDSELYDDTLLLVEWNMSICIHCGLIFKNDKHKYCFYCSKECYDKAQSNPVWKECLNCGKDYKSVPSDNQQFCSNKGWYAYLRNKHKITFTCKNPECRKLVRRRRGRFKVKPGKSFCSNKCVG